jgi:hypothetical protein
MTPLCLRCIDAEACCVIACRFEAADVAALVSAYFNHDSEIFAGKKAMPPKLRL